MTHIIEALALSVACAPIIAVTMYIGLNVLATSAVLGVTLTACAKIIDWYLK